MRKKKNPIQTLKNRWTAFRTKLTKEPDWVTVLESQDEYLIRIKHLALNDAEIPAVIFDQRDSSYNAFGYLYLKVQQKNMEKASKLLNSDHE